MLAPSHVPRGHTIIWSRLTFFIPYFNRPLIFQFWDQATLKIFHLLGICLAGCCTLRSSYHAAVCRVSPFAWGFVMSALRSPYNLSNNNNTTCSIFLLARSFVRLSFACRVHDALSCCKIFLHKFHRRARVSLLMKIFLSPDFRARALPAFGLSQKSQRRQKRTTSVACVDFENFAQFFLCKFFPSHSDFLWQFFRMSFMTKRRTRGKRPDERAERSDERLDLEYFARFFFRQNFSKLFSENGDVKH